MTTWIFLRGLTREARHWGDFPAAFRAALGDVRVITLDLPGNGTLNGQTSPTTVAGMLSACRAQLAQRGEQAPYRVLAMSLGAMVATAWAQQAPDELAGCVLINTSLRPFSPFFHRLRPRNYGALLGVALESQGALQQEDRILQLTSRHAATLRHVLPHWAFIRGDRPVSPGNALRQLAAAARFRAMRTTPAVPVLLLSSRNDGLVDARCSDAIARAWACAHAVHPSAGHDLPLDAPEWVIGQVCDWLRPPA